MFPFKPGNELFFCFRLTFFGSQSTAFFLNFYQQICFKVLVFFLRSFLAVCFSRYSHLTGVHIKSFYLAHWNQLSLLVLAAIFTLGIIQLFICSVSLSTCSFWNQTASSLHSFLGHSFLSNFVLELNMFELFSLKVLF